jgi:hypothetical protein
MVWCMVPNMYLSRERALSETKDYGTKHNFPLNLVLILVY